MKTGIFSLIGMLLAIVYVVYFSSQPLTALLFLPLAWIVVVWLLHGLSRAYIVTLGVGIMLDLHYFNFGLITVILLTALSAVYFIHISVISSTNAASTVTLGFLFPLFVYILMWVSFGVTSGFRYYPLSWGLVGLMIISALVLSVIMYAYCWLVRRITN